MTKLLLVRISAMNLDKIITINISKNTLQMSQTGFGIPLIIAEHDWPERIKVFSDITELPKCDAKLFGMCKALSSQNPKVSKFKIGKKAKNESIIEAFKAIKDEDSDFYGILLCSDDKSYGDDLKSLVNIVGNNRYLIGADLTKNQLDLGKYFTDKKCERIFSMYKGHDEDYPAAALMGKMLHQHPGSASWAFKQIEGVSKLNIPSDLLNNLETLNINRYVNIKDVGVVLDGRVASGEYIDIIHGTDWLNVRIQERLFRVLMTNPKIPYTLKGVDLVRSEILAQLQEGVHRGLLAASPEPQVSIPNIDEVDPILRGQRILPDVKFSARLAGAIHAVQINGNVEV